MPRTIGAVISSKLATKIELDTVYGLKDMWDLLEINAIDSHNRSLAQKEN